MLAKERTLVVIYDLSVCQKGIKITEARPLSASPITRHYIRDRTVLILGSYRNNVSSTIRLKRKNTLLIIIIFLKFTIAMRIELGKVARSSKTSLSFRQKVFSAANQTNL